MKKGNNFDYIVKKLIVRKELMDVTAVIAFDDC